jgi:hypothetical protein
VSLSQIVLTTPTESVSFYFKSRERVQALIESLKQYLLLTPYVCALITPLYIHSHQCVVLRCVALCCVRSGEDAFVLSSLSDHNVKPNASVSASTSLYGMKLPDQLASPIASPLPHNTTSSMSSPPVVMMTPPQLVPSHRPAPYSSTSHLHAHREPSPGVATSAVRGVCSESPRCCSSCCDCCLGCC